MFHFSSRNRNSRRIADSRIVDSRTLVLALAAVVIGVAATFIASFLINLIALFTNIAFFGRFETTANPLTNHNLGLFVLLVPIIGGLIIGLMARFGSKAIRGHGIPEAMEQILTNESRIPARLIWLKPLSAAISIGTGGPFGAEGPIIATGGALGSLVGQYFPATPSERKTLLAAGAAAGMTAIFGSPIAALLLAIELLLFEYRARSLIPVALAAAVAAAVRYQLGYTALSFPMSTLAPPSGESLFLYMVEGILLGVLAILVTWIVYAVEDAFERLPIHWMWWPAIGGAFVGVFGLIAPKTLGVGYENIQALVADDLSVMALLSLAGFKFISWALSLGSGTSGGTLAPLFTIGGALGALYGHAALWVMPSSMLNLHVAALVGMAGLFAGASRAFLASLLLAFETTGQFHSLLPLLAGCTSAFATASLLARNSIMTEKIVRRGVHVPSDYSPDLFESIFVRNAATTNVVSFSSQTSTQDARKHILSGHHKYEHNAFPIVNNAGELLGLVSRETILKATTDNLEMLIDQDVYCVFDDDLLRVAIEKMLTTDTHQLIVIPRGGRRTVLGLLTRGDILAAQNHFRMESRHRTHVNPTPNELAS